MDLEKESRRNFIKKSALGVGAVTAMSNPSTGFAQGQDKKKQKKLPREVWIATVSQHELFAESSREMITKVLNIMDEIVPLKPDIICLPEVFPFSNIPKRPPLVESADKPVGPVIQPFAEFARKHNCYVICSTYTIEAGKYYNAAVLIDRQGNPMGEYRKIFPTEGEIERGISPGPIDPPVFETDFGKIGMQICFDSQWIDGWRKLQRSEAEIVFWPSAYSGGEKLNAFAGLFNYHVVSSTRKDASKIIDLTGKEIASTGRWEPNWICAGINLEKEVIPSWPYYIHFKNIEARYGRNVKITTLHDQEISIIESLSPDLKIADILLEFKIKTRKEYLQSAESVQEKARKI